VDSRVSWRGEREGGKEEDTWEGQGVRGGKWKVGSCEEGPGGWGGGEGGNGGQGCVV